MYSRSHIGSPQQTQQASHSKYSILEQVQDWKKFLQDSPSQSVKPFEIHKRAGRPIASEYFIEKASKLVGRDLKPKNQDRCLLAIKYRVPDYNPVAPRKTNPSEMALTARSVLGAATEIEKAAEDFSCSHARRRVAAVSRSEPQVTTRTKLGPFHIAGQISEGSSMPRYAPPVEDGS